MTRSLRIDTPCRFAFLVSSRGPLTCDDAGRLTGCHRALVSNSCHFFEAAGLKVQSEVRDAACGSDGRLPFRHVTPVRLLGQQRSHTVFGSPQVNQALLTVLDTPQPSSLRINSYRSSENPRVSDVPVHRGGDGPSILVALGVPVPVMDVPIDDSDAADSVHFLGPLHCNRNIGKDARALASRPNSVVPRRVLA
jgi:hypothetical protein